MASYPQFILIQYQEVGQKSAHTAEPKEMVTKSIITNIFLCHNVFTFNQPFNGRLACVTGSVGKSIEFSAELDVCESTM